MQENFYKYLTNYGELLNNQLKFNIYFKQDDLIHLLLFDYILDTLNNYDYRNCPEYDDKENPIIIEDFSIYKLIDTDSFEILTQSGETILLNFPRNYNQNASLINEEESLNIIAENNIEKYKFDKENIKKYLYKLAKNLKCYE